MSAPSVAAPVRRDPYQPYRQRLLTSQRVRELSRLRPLRVVRDVAFAWSAILVAWAIAAEYTTPLVVLGACVVVGTRYYALFIIGHDGLHRRLFADRRMNDLFCDVFMLGPIGAITRLNNRNHLGHHQHLATDADPDRHKHGCFNKTDLSELLGYLSGATSIVRSVRNVFLRGGTRGGGSGLRGGTGGAGVGAGATAGAGGDVRDAGRDGYGLRDLAILMGVQLALVGGLTLTFGWWGWAVMWAAPVYCFTYLGDSIRSFAEHSHPENDARADEHRLITYVSNPVERMFLAPMHMNFHAAHHLWVSIPYYHLPIADAEMREHPLARELKWRTSYVGYLVRYALALPLDECRAAGPRAAAR